MTDIDSMSEINWTHKAGDYGSSSWLWGEVGEGNQRIRVGGNFKRFKTRADERAAMALIEQAIGDVPGPGNYRVTTKWDLELARAQFFDGDEDSDERDQSDAS